MLLLCIQWKFLKGWKVLKKIWKLLMRMFFLLYRLSILTAALKLLVTSVCGTVVKLLFNNNSRLIINIHFYASHHLAVAPQLGAKDQFYSTIYNIN